MYLLDLGGFSIDESGRITVNSGSAPIGNPPPPQGFHHQPQHDVHVQGDHHQLPESPAAQPVIPHVSCLHLKQQQQIKLLSLLILKDDKGRRLTRDHCDPYMHSIFLVYNIIILVYLNRK